MTIQFPAFERGNVGFFPAVLAGPPKHIAVPIPSVSVGVTNIRKKFELELAQSIHPAPRLLEALTLPREPMTVHASAHAASTFVELHADLESRENGDIGHMTGNV